MALGNFYFYLYVNSNPKYLFHFQQNFLLYLQKLKLFHQYLISYFLLAFLTDSNLFSILCLIKCQHTMKEGLKNNLLERFDKFYC